MAELEAAANLNQDSSNARGRLTRDHQGSISSDMYTIVELEGSENIRHRRGSSFISFTKSSKRGNCCKAIVRARVALNYFILTAYEKAFGKFGFFLARKPLVVLLVWLLVVFGSCVGFRRLHVEKPSFQRFTTDDSQSRKDLDRAAQFFPLLEARQEQFLMIPKHGQNILSDDCLKEALLVHQAIVNITGYSEICSKQFLSNTTQKDGMKSCVISSPLELAGTHFESLRNFTSILDRELKNPTTILSTGETFNSSFNKMLSNFQFKSNTDPSTAHADALRVIYFLRKPTGTDKDQAVLNFENSFESLLLSMGRNLKCAALSFKTGKTAEDALQNVLQPELKPLYLSASVLVLIVFFVIYLSSNILNCLTAISLIISAIILPFICVTGINSMANISLFPSSLLIPFLLLGKATADVVLLLREWEQHKVPSLEHRVSNCVTRAGLPSLLSSLCGTVLIGIAIKSSFDVISEFFIIATVTFAIVSISSFIVTVTLLTYFERRLETSCVPHFHRRSSLAEVGSVQKGSIQWLNANLRHFLRGFSEMVTSRGGKILSLFIFACIIGLCVSSALQPDERMGTTQTLYQNENFKRFSGAQQTFFGKETDTSIVFPKKVEYSRESVQSDILNTCKMLQEASYSARDSSCWMASLQQWARFKRIRCSNSNFDQCLDVFLNQFRHVPFRQDLHFSSGKLRRDILASRVHVKMVVRNRYREDRRSLQELRKDLSSHSSQEAIPISEKFLELDDLSLLETDTIFVLIIATVVVFVHSLLASSSFRISTYLAITLDILVLEAAGIMETWGIHLHHISFLTLYLTIILSLSFSIQVAHSFVFSEKQAVRDRMAEAMNSVLWSLLVASVIGITGSISLAFIYPSLAAIFSRLIPLVLVLGLIHALLISPPFIVLIFEFVDSFTCQNDLDMLPTHTERNIMLLRAQDDHLHQPRSKRPCISVVGISCRFPGASSKDLFWDLLEKGKSSISAFPQNRKEEHKAFFQLYNPKRFVSGRLCAVNGSYLEKVQTFDNKFFGISNQEARVMDPQQRILLQVVYEAIEDAGMRLEDLQRCRTGVFVGVMNLEYGALLTDQSNYHNIDQFSSTGITASILANRVSFCLNLTGPSLAVDTACSSSLTALKLACDNLHNEDCDIAIVCAPNIILDHSMQMVSSMAGLLAPDGRCKSFDASGDGYGRGEGFAAVILKLSNAALSDKDDEYCEIIAYGMNNDGQNAIPMTAPSAKMQAELSRMVLEKSGLNPEEVDYFEAHGTGTAIGDVIEVTSIADTYTKGQGKPRRKLRIGSVKSNLNHTESTSGLAGLIKVALMIKNKRLVPTVNVNVLNPKLKLEEKGLIVQQTSEHWNTESGKPRIGAVNSFGYGGSNVHVILREVTSKETSEQEEPVDRLNYILTISARSKEALQKMAYHYSEWLKDHFKDVNKSFINDLCYSLNERRSQLPYRLALAFGSTNGASKTLADYANDSLGWDKLASYGEVNSTDPKIVFMFGGQGSQWYAMGRQLIETEETFKEAILTVSNIVKDMGMTWSLVDELMVSEDQSRISENCMAQPATFAVQYATAQLLMSWRIYPSAVIGHSLGEFAAACVSGILTVKEAVQLVLIRSTLQDKCPNNGSMAALGMSEEKAKELLTELKLSTTLSIAAVNDARSVTLSGDSESIDAFGQHLAIHATDTFWRVLGTKRAFHSSHMEVIKKPFQAAMKRITLKPKLSKIPMYSTVEGRILEDQQFTSDYWWRNIRCPVQFYPAMKHLLLDGYKQIIEISTQPILAHYVKQIALQSNLKDQMPVVMATLPRKRVPVQEQHKSFLRNTICELYTLGFPIDWPCVQRSPSATFVRSLNYPWHENSFWYREHPPTTTISPLGTEQSIKKLTHPFLGQVKKTALFSGLHCWETEIDVHRFASLKDHALIQGGTVMPGAAYLEMAFAMAKDKFVDIAGIELSYVKLSSLLTLPETQVRSLRLRLIKTDRIDTTEFNITSVQDDHSEIKLSSGRISVDLLHKREMGKDEAPKQVGPAVNALASNMTKMPMERFREITEAFGFNYGPTYSIIKQIWHCNNEGLCLVDISESLEIQTEAADYVIHPCILDACLQSCFVPLGISSTNGKSIVPVGFKSIILNDVPSSNQLYCHVTADANDFGKFDVSLMSPSGNVLLTMCEFRIAELTSSPRQLGFVDLAYEVNWKEEELTLEERKESVEHLTCVVLKDSTDFSNTLISRLKVAKVKVITIDPPGDGAYNNEMQKEIETVFSSIPKRDSANLRVINMWPVETTRMLDNFGVIEQAQSIAFSSSAFLIKLLVIKECLDSRLFLVTESTQALWSSERSPETKSMPWGSTVWGLRRTANLEEFRLRVTAIDLDSKKNVDEIDTLVDEILGDSIEDEVAFREGKRFINRLERLQTFDKETTITRMIEINKKHSLYLSTIPSSGKLCLREQSLSKSSSPELTIDLFYCWTPSESLIDIAKPKRCVFVVGKVTGVPEKSDFAFQIGDEVCGVLSSGRVSRSLSIQVSDAFKKPASMTKKQASFIPACLAIASHALQIAVSGGQNQKLLIHEANRGPGPAAVVLAKTSGHRVFCTIPDTCQTFTKTALLEMGAEGVLRQSSPNLSSDYNDPFDAVVFFYPPSPNALQKSSRSLKRGGRVIILSSEFHGDVIFPANTSVKYEREDMAHILLSPLAFEKLSLESIKLLEDKGALEKLLSMPLETVELTNSIKAVNTSIDNQSTPKFHVKAFSDISFLIYSCSLFEDNHLQNIPILPRGLDGCGLKGNRTYLVAGGMRGFGFEVARWMVENGARSLGLIGRSKPQEDKYQQLREIERETGAKIHTFQVDISNQTQMSSFKQRLQSLPSVAGIVHTAMVLRDEFIKDLTFESFIEVLGPKIKGSFLLHEMSLEMDLDFFVMFSSMASIVGNMGQSSYSACNAFQDALAQYRRHTLGLPALAINWGPISGAGVMERESGIAKLLTMAGLGFIHAKEGVKHMAKVLNEEPGRCQISLFDADWPRFIKSNPGLRKTSRLSAITAEINAPESQTRSTESLAQRIILEKDCDKRAELVNEYVAILVTEWTGISSPSETDLNKSLYSYGADSTASLTLKMQLESNLQVSFEVFYFMQPDTTPLKMAKDITFKLGTERSNSQPSNEQTENSENREGGLSQTQPTIDMSQSNITPANQIQVIPLYTPAGSAIKFFCVHPSHRYAMSLVPISTGFRGQKLVSFYALGFTDPTAVSEDWVGVRELAAHYVQLISEEQRHGPYFLGGYSYGGLVAYEMASLLTEQNQRVECVAMIDTFPWSPLSQKISTRVVSMQEDGNSQRRHVKLQFESFLKKLALDSLKMTDDEYLQLREEHTQDGAIEELQRRSIEKGLTTHNLKALRESLLSDQTIANRTHHKWQPPRVRYRGPITFLKCQDTRFSPTRLRSSDSAEDVWGQLVDGGTSVLICPGDHYSLSELPHAHVTGSILATALAFNYRTLFPEFPRPSRTFHQRRAVEKFCSGVRVFLHSKKGNKWPHFGELFLTEDAHKLELRSKIDEGRIEENEKTKKIIDVQDLRMVQPGRLVSSAQKYVWRKRRVGADQSGNLGQVASVITGRRVYNLEFTDYSDLKAFYNMIEALFAVTLLTS